jgi:hypothetical protein
VIEEKKTNFNVCQRPFDVSGVICNYMTRVFNKNNEAKTVQHLGPFLTSPYFAPIISPLNLPPPNVEEPLFYDNYGIFLSISGNCAVDVRFVF